MKQNEIRPGVYVNVGVNNLKANSFDQSGIVTIPLDLDWGEAEGFIMIKQNETPLYKLGRDLKHIQMLPIREALKKCESVLVYRLNGGTKASATLATNVTATAKYPGTRGNDITVTVKVDTDTSIVTVKTFFDDVEMDIQKVTTVSEFKDNGLVIITGAGTFVDASIKLTSGANKTVAGSLSKYLEALITQEFNTIAYTGTDEASKTLIIDWVKEHRGDNAKLVQAVLENVTANHEGIISVKNGVILEEGTQLLAKDCTAFVAGATAGATAKTSNTYALYEGAVDCNPRLTPTQIENAILTGHICFARHNQGVAIEYDINTLTSFGNKSKDFRKNKIVRVVDRMTQDIIAIYEVNYIGKVQNNTEGRNRLKGTLAEYLQALQNAGVIEEFITSDIIIEALQDKDSVSVKVGVKPVDSIDKIYIDVEVR
ncbi:MAG: phage tail sheath subtilisin-like domain-containing protein [Anaerorhabdus sp.]|uniref:phage tail sheath subtilisin-like domain-containing protein n=1 Tax=Anaerorhabdus sp. TaxID=1872524 RepID=UPI003A87602B